MACTYFISFNGWSYMKLYSTDSIKYLGIGIAKNLNWKHDVSDIAIKLNRVNALLFKIQNFVNVNTLKTIMQSLTRMLIMPMWFGLKILLLWIECLSFRKRPRELLVFSQDIVIQALCLKNRIYLNLKIKFNLKMYSWSVNTSIIYFHKFLTNGSHFAPIYIIITQLPPALYVAISYSQFSWVNVGLFLG